MNPSVPDLCDDFEDRLRVLEPLFRDFGGRERFSGPISTVKCHEDNSRVKEALAEAGEGRVLVVDGGGSLRHALLGDMLAAMGAENGWSGVVVYGCVRDVEITRTIELGLRAIAPHPVKSVKRGEGQRDVPVRFAGVTIQPGAVLYADANGLVIADEDLGVSFNG
ncbi:MAG: ribonuclease E activity regulator RraA [Xanthomonadales bacterium]|jgi:regulator of ribonuclease activity A|nr:ribonuclease E activity regulator RraA [Xanthomonadales bacterium]